MTADKAALPQVLKLAESIRCMNNNLQVLTNTNGGSFKSQFKKADKSGARLALILGEEELAGQFLSVKDLRNDVAQMTIKFDELNQFLKNYLGD
jgi:histidyl-tRNA synthetase